MTSVSVILPTYNEAENIGPLISSIASNVSYLKEILVVDDNSPDKTSTHAINWAKKYKLSTLVRVIVRTKDNGLTKSIAEGIREARGNCVVWMDADFSHPPEYINALVKAVDNGADIAVASRFVPGGKSKTVNDETESQAAVFLSTLANTSMNVLFQVPFHDFTSGFIAAKKSCLTTLPLHGSYGEYFIDFIIRAFAKQYSVVEIPYLSPSRLHGTSKTAPNLRILFLRLQQYGGVVLSLLWKKYFTKTL